MKKSQLRQIIRESINELVIEQSGGPNFNYQVPPVYNNPAPTPNNCPPEGCRRVGIAYCGASGGGDAQGLGNNLSGGALKYLYDNSLQVGDLVTVTANNFSWNNGINAFYSDQNKVTGVIMQLFNTYSGGGSTGNPGDFAPKPSLATWPYDPSLGNANDPDCGGVISTPTCTHGNTSPCASQWFQNPNASWAANWMNNRDCSNYTWPATNLETQALAIMANAPNPQPNVYNDWNDIWGAANAAFPNTTGGPKAQFINKMAKAKFSQCQKQACNC